MRKTFAYEYEEGRPNALSYEVSLEEDERIETLIENGTPILYMNRSAMLTMSKILIKIAQGSYADQFHVHLKKDFADGPDAVIVMLRSDGEEIQS